MKIYLFGSSGMLGNYVLKVLEPLYEIIKINREHYDVETCDYKKLETIFHNSQKNDIIINCIGLIPQRNPNIKNLITINTIFPIKLSEFANKYNLKYIHITTDCVFSGKNGMYNENSEHDSNESYGITKSLGENIHACIIRTSIIGEEKNNKLSLLEWIKKNKNGNIKGYTNFFWNGITCLTLAETIKDIIQNNKYWIGIRHIYSPNIISKYKLCKIINEVYKLNIDIEKHELEIPKNMTLTSLYNTIDYTIFNILPIELQIKNMYNFLFTDL